MRGAPLSRGKGADVASRSNGIKGEQWVLTNGEPLFRVTGAPRKAVEHGHLPCVASRAHHSGCPDSYVRQSSSVTALWGVAPFIIYIRRYVRYNGAGRPMWCDPSCYERVRGRGDLNGTSFRTQMFFPSGSPFEPIHFAPAPAAERSPGTGDCFPALVATGPSIFPP